MSPACVETVEERVYLVANGGGTARAAENAERAARITRENTL